MSSSEIRKDMQEFQAAVKKLSGGIAQASPLWKDSRFADLSASVSRVASELKDFMVAGDECCIAVDRFDRIASEKY